MLVRQRLASRPSPSRGGLTLDVLPTNSEQRGRSRSAKGAQRSRGRLGASLGERASEPLRTGRMQAMMGVARRKA